MSRLAPLRDRLPSLYRPEDGDTGLLSRLLRAVARALEGLDREAADVMQAHWLDTADRARFNAFFLRSREVAGQPPPALDDPALVQFPYISDLARLGALLALLPWQDPIPRRETVEAYRQRIRRIVALYRNGLATVSALRAIVEAQLPVDLTRPAGLQDRPLTLEEFAPLIVRTRAVRARGAPLEMVGPLMRWSLENDGLEPAAPTVYLQGVTPVPGRIDPTERPVLELYEAGGERIRLGIAYEGTVKPGQTLRLRPAYASWIGRDDGLLRAESLPMGDPTAPGPWQPVPGDPGVAVRALLAARDGTLWVATTAVEGPGTLRRFNGQDWSEVLSDLPAPHCLAQDGDDLLVGTTSGLLRLPLYPKGAGPVPVPDPNDLNGPAIYALLRTSDGTWWAGTEDGLARLGANDALEPFGLHKELGTGTSVSALHQDRTGTLYLGTELGLFQFQPGTGHWYWFAGKEHSDQIPDWKRFFPEKAGADRQFPGPDQVFLPPVLRVRRGPDASLWIGTDQGIARYVARAVGGGLTYTTLLEAFPDLETGRVFSITEDARGLIWFATERGLFRHDGRDWWQVQDGVPVRLGAGDAAPADPTRLRLWRFRRATARWESFDPGSRRDAWVAYQGIPRGVSQDAVRVLIWTDFAVADLGTWDGSQFIVDAGATVAPLRMRSKPTERTIVDGGQPAVPRLPVGRSVWRYLRREPDEFIRPASRPAWTIEGRLLSFLTADREPPQEGRFGAAAPLDLSRFDDAVLAFNPSARVWFTWEASRPLTALARLRTTGGEGPIDPAVLDRVWQGIQQVRPAGVRVVLAVDEQVVRGL